VGFFLCLYIFHNNLSTSFKIITKYFKNKLKVWVVLYLTMNCSKAEYIFKELNGWPDYYITNTGLIISKKKRKPRELKQRLGTDGYLAVYLRKDNKTYYKSVHRLLAINFIPNSQNSPNIDHIDRNRLNNDLSNLRWATKSDNERNKSLAKDNTSGYQGVCKSVSKKGNASWRAQWIDEKKRSKSFSVRKFGENEAKTMAIAYREKMVDLYYNRVKT